MSTSPALEVVDVHVDPVSALLTDVSAGTGADATNAAMCRGFGRLMCYAQRAGLSIIGHPRVLHASRVHASRVHTPTTPTFASVTLALPVVAPVRAIAQTPSIRLADLSGMQAWRFSHCGSFQGLAATYALIVEWLVSRGVLASVAEWGRLTPVWEEYVCDPASTLMDEVLAFIYVPRGLRPSRRHSEGWAA